MASVDQTHDPDLRSWVASANGHSEFPIQNLPFGIFNTGGEGRGGIAIGDEILDISAVVALGCFSDEIAGIAAAASLPRLNRFMAMGEDASTALRAAVSKLLATGNPHQEKLAATLIPQAAVSMEVPCDIGDFTDFLTSLPHTERLGKLKGLEDPVPPAFKTLPVAYHGRSSSIRVSGTPVVRPTGQWRRADGRLVCEPVQSLDYELELGALIGQASTLATPVPLADARRHIFGYCLVNDWSAKGIQWWEQILGPFLGKNFMTSVSPWIVTSQALTPFHRAARVRRAEDGPIFPYLQSGQDAETGSLSVEFSAKVTTRSMRDRKADGYTVSRSSLECMYWTFGQMLAHHTSNGCPIRAGDLLASGTLSGETAESMACLSERTVGGKEPIDFGGGEMRGWLMDGDEVVMTGHAHREGFVSIGFGECRGIVKPAGLMAG